MRPRYLTVERGLGEATARGYVDAVRPFLRCYVSADGLALDVDQLSEAGVTAFMVTRCAEQSRRAAQSTATALRSLLGFLHVTGVITHSLAAGCSVGSWPTIGRAAAAPRGRPRRAPARRLRSPDPCRAPRLCGHHHAGPSRPARRRSGDPAPRRLAVACWRDHRARQGTPGRAHAASDRRGRGDRRVPSPAPSPAYRVAPSSSVCSLLWRRSVPPA